MVAEPLVLTLPYRTVAEACEEIDAMDSPHELRSLLDAVKQEGRMVSLAIQYREFTLNPLRAWFRNRGARRRLNLLASICNAIDDRAGGLLIEPPKPEATP